MYYIGTSNHIAVGLWDFQLFSIANDAQKPFGKSCFGQTPCILLSVGQCYRGNQMIWIFLALKTTISKFPFLSPSQIYIYIYIYYWLIIYLESYLAGMLMTL